MSRIRNVLAMLAAVTAAALLVPAAHALAPTPDTVTLRDGSAVPCRVLVLDDRRLLVAKDDGGQQSIPRADVVRIDFGQAAPPPIAARLHVDAGDDLVRVRLDGREIATPAELRAGWIDLAPLLRDGPNVIEAEVENGGGVWAYRWTIEAGGRRETFACGLVNAAGCRENGATGKEKGVFPAGKLYVYVHRDVGEVSLQR